MDNFITTKLLSFSVSIERFAKKELLSFHRPFRRPSRKPDISLSAGDPDFNQPKFIADAVAKAILDGYTHYVFDGDSEFKEEIAKYYGKYGVKVDSQSQVLLTSGGSPAIFRILGAFVNPGDQVIILDPTFQVYTRCIQYFGGEVVRAPMVKNEDGYFRTSIENIEKAITDRTKMLIICNPDNPTGCVYTEDELKQIAELAIKHDFLVMSDEIYTEFIWCGRRHVTIMSIPGMEERSIVVMSFSKMFAWTGLRVGFIISSPEIISLIKRVPMGVCSIPVPIQRAGIVALREGWDFVEMMRREYLKRVEFCVKRLNEIPAIHCVKPEGTFYVFPDISETNLKSRDYCEKLLEAEGVSVVPGSNYGDMGEGHIRLALVKPLDVLEDALNRIERFTRKIIG